MNDMSTPIAAVRYGPCTPERDEREHDEAGPGAVGERLRDGEHDEQGGHRDRHGDRGEHGCAADEREHAAAAAEVGEDGKGVADHRGAGADVGEAPHARVGERHPDQRGGDPLGDVADEHGQRRATSERLLGVPVPGVVVADGAEIDSGATPGDEVGHRDRPEQVPDDRRDDHAGRRAQLHHLTA